ncbi:hypothetical protein APED_00995 [Acanthopleuribacter pedis]
MGLVIRDVSGVGPVRAFPFVNAIDPGCDHFQWSYPGLNYGTLLGCVQCGRALPGVYSKHGPWIRWRGPLRGTPDQVPPEAGSRRIRSHPRPAHTQSGPTRSGVTPDQVPPEGGSRRIRSRRRGFTPEQPSAEAGSHPIRPHPKGAASQRPLWDVPDRVGPPLIRRYRLTEQGR